MKKKHFNDKGYVHHQIFDCGELAFCRNCGYTFYPCLDFPEMEEEDAEALDIANMSCDEVIKEYGIKQSGIDAIEYRKKFPPFTADYYEF